MARGSMKLAYVLFFASLVFCFAYSLAESEDNGIEALARDAYTGNSHAYFVDHPFHYLDVHPIESSSVTSSLECSLACLRVVTCFSFNVAAKPNEGLTLCELLPSDKYNSSDKFKANPLFHHHSLYTSCSQYLCKNGGKCIASYFRSDFTCSCSSKSKGKKCEAVVGCPQDWREFKSFCYMFSLDKMTWDGANAACRHLGAMLVTIKTADENTFVQTHVKDDIWIGISDEAYEGRWEWVDGSKVTYRNFNTGEPNGGRSENYGLLYRSSGRWNDAPNGSIVYYVCKK